MNEAFFRQLEIPAPDVSLEVGSASHARQTAEVMMRFEQVVEAERPDCVLVVGDVNSTIACALVAAKLGIRVVHVEAGLRSRDRSMPEEINRILTDQLSGRLYVTERSAIGNLTAEGIEKEKIVFAGNVMIDTLLHNLPRAVPAAETIASATRERGGRGVEPGKPHAVLTLHRPSNVDAGPALASLLNVIGEVAEDLPVVFPVHPRTRARIDDAGFGTFFDNPRILALPPVGYLEMLGLVNDADVVLTDSGGLQEETTALGIPCMTLRENTERPITIAEGTNTLVGVDPVAIRTAWAGIRAAERGSPRRPENWDGKAAERIVADLGRW
jgi:UDP-N-acetylglucosamine 2-epimerase (non-hydrolysing)